MRCFAVQLSALRACDNTHIALKTLWVICGVRCALRCTCILSHNFKLYFLNLCGNKKLSLGCDGGKESWEERRGQRWFNEALTWSLVGFSLRWEAPILASLQFSPCEQCHPKDKSQWANVKSKILSAWWCKRTGACAGALPALTSNAFPCHVPAQGTPAQLCLLQSTKPQGSLQSKMESTT